MSPSPSTASPGALFGPPVLALVVSEFGRDAALRFCAALSHGERERIIERAAVPFFDEYRRLTLAVVGDLPFVKQEALAPYQRHGRPLDQRVLVGFPDGVALEAVVPRLGVLALEGMRGAVDRGVARVLVLLPCNTLAPASWALEQHFAAPAQLEAMLAAALPGRAELRRQLCRQGAGLLAAARIEFPTVPEAVLRAAHQQGAEAVLPLGTLAIVQTYREAQQRAGVAPEVVAPDPAGQQQVLQAIQAGISRDPAARRQARRDLQALIARARAEHGTGLWVVEACTDLDYGLGLSSTELYARWVVDHVYGPRHPSAAAER